MFKMPYIHAPFRDVVNPYLDEASRLTAGWIESAGLTPTPEARLRMRRTDPQGASAYTWPYANRDELMLCIKWLATVFRLDDQLDEPAVAVSAEESMQVTERLCALFEGTTAARETPVDQAVAELWQETAYGQPPDWRAAFVDSMQKWLRTYPAEALLDMTGEYLDFDTYLDHREYSVGMPWLYDLAARGLGLPQAVREAPALRSLRRAAAVHSALVNDLFSVRREAMVGYPHNAVLILRRETGCSLQEAADEVGAYIAHRAEEMLAAYSALSQGLQRDGVPLTTQIDALAYADRIMACTRGQITWHSTSARYATDDISSPGGSLGYPADLLPPSSPWPAGF